MLKIFYKTGLYNYELENNECDFLVGGMVATFSANRIVTICRPNNMPIGFFIYDYNYYHDLPDEVYIVNHMPGVTIAVGQGEYSTDVYEDGTYKINDLLYCGGSGRISNSKIYRGNPIIGIVNSVCEDEIGFITSFSNLEMIRFGGKDEIQAEKTKVVPT